MNSDGIVSRLMIGQPVDNDAIIALVEKLQDERDAAYRAGLEAAAKFSDMAYGNLLVYIWDAQGHLKAAQPVKGIGDAIRALAARPIDSHAKVTP